MKALAFRLWALAFVAASGLALAGEAPVAASSGAAPIRASASMESSNASGSVESSHGVAGVAVPEQVTLAPEQGTVGPQDGVGMGREVSFSDVDVSVTLPEDFVRPEGRTRWDLTGLSLQTASSRALVDGSRSITVRERRNVKGKELVTTSVYTDAHDGVDAAHWLHPERFGQDLIPGTRNVLMLDEQAASEPPSGWDRRVRLDGDPGPATDHLWIDLETVGIGWVHLPDGPREVVLQRALILRETADGPGYQPELLRHRWVASQIGVVAEVWGPPTPDGKGRERVIGGRILNGGAEILAALTKMYEGELIAPVRTGIGYGWDRGNVPIAELTSQGYVTAGDLVNANVWDFTVGPSTHTLTGTTTANNSTTINGSGSHFQDELRLRDKIALSSAPAVFATVTGFDFLNPQTRITVSPALGNGTSQTILRKRAEVSNTSTPVDANETCNAGKCGYSSPGAAMDRLDRYFDDPAALGKTNAVRQRTEMVGSDATYWLRAGAQNEGLSGGLGMGESRFCYDPTTGRTPVPLWRFGHHDAGGYYVQPGDSWTSTPFNCEKNIFNGVCASDSCGFPCPIWVKSCPGHTGTQGGTAIKSGVLTVPSGHTFNALLFRTVADFCVYINNSCGTATSQVRTVVYLWQVPLLGTVVELDSAQNAPDTTSFTSVASTIINFGLFPPRTIQATASTNTSVSLSWDPGLDTHRITGYRVYWDTDSGGASSYAFNSTSNPGQVSFAGTTATVSGLTPGTIYYFTVTALSTFTDPSSSVVTTYESLLYPTQVSGVPGLAYPIEVQASTKSAGCTPGTAVTGLMLLKLPDDKIRFTWNPVSDPCAVGYRVYGNSAPTPPASFGGIADTGLGTSWTGNPPPGYFLVVARGNNGNVGP